ncbi:MULTISPECIES: hypothetical protein [unclassified Microbacterium]|uniref:hypothetical protein n=1 Tax=unclassified Microbacterium TaxID=2609290 RepID=UPI0038704C99
MTTTLLEDFLSGETSRVLHATWQVLGSRDPALVDPLVPHIARIRAATENLDLGGMLRPNSANVRYALEKLEHRGQGLCWCQDYPGPDHRDPTREEKDGHVRILSTSAPGWSMTYECECTVCGRIYAVEQGDYHVMWWRWRGAKRDR